MFMLLHRCLCLVVTRRGVYVVNLASPIPCGKVSTFSSLLDYLKTSRCTQLYASSFYPIPCSTYLNSRRHNRAYMSSKVFSKVNVCSHQYFLWWLVPGLLLSFTHRANTGLSATYIAIAFLLP